MNKRSWEPVVVDDADVERFFDVILTMVSRPDPDDAYQIALDAQRRSQMTTAYAEEFARKVRRRAQQWVRAPWPSALAGRD